MLMLLAARWPKQLNCWWANKKIFCMPQRKRSELISFAISLSRRLPADHNTIYRTSARATHEHKTMDGVEGAACDIYSCVGRRINWKSTTSGWWYLIWNRICGVDTKRTICLMALLLLQVLIVMMIYECFFFFLFLHSLAAWIFPTFFWFFSGSQQMLTQVMMKKHRTIFFSIRFVIEFNI